MSKSNKGDRAEQHEAPRQPYMDDIYFHISQVGHGTKLLRCGRFEARSIWEVLDIKSHYLGKVVGDIKIRKVDKLRRIGDILIMRNIETGEVRSRVFGYMASNAGWRLYHD